MDEITIPAADLRRQAKVPTIVRHPFGNVRDLVIEPPPAKTKEKAEAIGDTPNPEPKAKPKG